MSLQVGGLRQQPAAVRHIAACQNPHCGNKNLTKLLDYRKCNVCGWDTRMNAQDILDRFGPLNSPGSEPIPGTAEGASGEDALPPDFVATQDHLLFLQSRGYTGDAEASTEWIKRMAPQERKGFFAEFDEWMKANANGNWAQCKECDAAYELSAAELEAMKGGQNPSGLCFRCAEKMKEAGSGAVTPVTDGQPSAEDLDKVEAEKEIAAKTAGDMQEVPANAQQVPEADEDDTDPDLPAPVSITNGRKGNGKKK
jgi:hypothetical protein